MFLDEPQTNQPPEIIALPGARNAPASEARPDRRQAHQNVYPQPITLSTLWDKRGPDNLTPTDGEPTTPGGFGEREDWNDGQFAAALELAAGLSVVEAATAVDATAMEAVTVAFAIQVAEVQTMINAPAQMETVALALALAVAEQQTMAEAPAQSERVDMSLALSATESTTAESSTLQEAMALSLTLTVTER